jgi:hypothetical protein
MDFQNTIGFVVVEYNKYVEAQKKDGKDAVSFLKYAFGNL